jgi:hypothetical protein
VFDNVVEDMRRRGGGGEALLVINLDVKGETLNPKP